MDSDNELTKLVAFCTFTHHNLLGGGGVCGSIANAQESCSSLFLRPCWLCIYTYIFLFGFSCIEASGPLVATKKLKIKKNNIGVYYLFALT